MIDRAQRENPFFGAAFFLVAPRPAEGRIKAVLIKRLLQPLGFHDIGMHLRARSQRADPCGHTIGIDMDDQIETEAGHRLVAEADHLAEFPAGIDMQQRKRQSGRIKRLLRQMQQDSRILADRIQQHRLVAGGHHLAQDENRLGFQSLQMSQSGHQTVPARCTRPSSPICKPHSLWLSCSHHQRPARSSSPSVIARVHGAQPIETKPCSCSGLIGTL